MISVNNIQDKQEKIRFVCISDTHGKTNFEIPDGDVLSKLTILFTLYLLTTILVHAGDISRRSTIKEYEETFLWLSTLPHK